MGYIGGSHAARPMAFLHLDPARIGMSDGSGATELDLREPVLEPSGLADEVGPMGYAFDIPIPDEAAPALRSLLLALAAAIREGKRVRRAHV